jgi:hypothetical protein
LDHGGKDMGTRAALWIDAANELMGDPEPVAISSLRVIELARHGALNRAHVAALAELNGDWGSILIWGIDNVVIDGAHRVSAAKRLGLSTLAASRVGGSLTDAFIKAVRANSKHGLPLSLSDRRRAAVRILMDRPASSDRWIADVCALSAKTVAHLRAETAASSGLPPLDTRIGRDGKVRPIRAGQARQKVLDALAQNPAGSLRTIAAAAGASPETVRIVRLELAGANGLRRIQPSPETIGILDEVCASRASCQPNFLSDNALRQTRFVEWLAHKAIDDWRELVDSVPVSRVYLVADEARRQAAQWKEFAVAVEARARHTST